MVYANNFLRLVVSGSLYFVEEFSFSLSMIAEVPGNEPLAPTEVPPAVISATTALWGVSGMFTQHCRLMSIKLNEIGQDGRYTHDSTVRYDYPTPIQGVGSAMVPPQVAFAVSLKTAAARGRAHAGRFYLPMPQAQVDVTGMLSGGSVSVIRSGVDLWLQALNNALPGWQVGVTSSIGLGQERPVTNAAYGRTLDTIRSRRDKFTEQHVTGNNLN